MIGAEANSSGSNWAPKAKLIHYTDKKTDQVSVASLKFKVMMQMCRDNIHKNEIGEITSNGEAIWNFDDICAHQEKMLAILLG